MSNGRFLRYYWEIRTFLSQRAHLLDTQHKAHKICESYEIEYAGTFWASIVFQNGSRLIVRFSLKSHGEVEEYNYAYQYLDPQGERILRYDDAPHHPEISTHPHHLHRGPESKDQKERVYALDIDRVDFFTVLNRILQLIT
jgi:hypothetical protein